MEFSLLNRALKWDALVWYVCRKIDQNKRCALLNFRRSLLRYAREGSVNLRVTDGGSRYLRGKVDTTLGLAFLARKFALFRRTALTVLGLSQRRTAARGTGANRPTYAAERPSP